MARAPNFADAEYEPSDAELVQLAAEAFADVRESRERALAVLRAHISEEREKVLQRIDAMAKAAALGEK